MGASGMNALRIHDRKVLEAVIVQELFVSAFKDESDIDAQEAWHWCRDRIESPNLAVIVARNDESNLVGLAIANYNPSVWSPDPWVPYLYSNGEKQVVGALLAEMRVWGLGLGQKRVRWRRPAGVSEKGAIRFARKFLTAEIESSVIVGEWKED